MFWAKKLYFYMNFKLNFQKTPYRSRKNIIYILLILSIYFTFSFLHIFPSSWLRVLELLIILFAFRTYITYQNTICMISFEEGIVKFARFKDKRKYSESHSKNELTFIDNQKGYIIIYNKKEGRSIYGKQNQRLYRNDWLESYEKIKECLV